MARAALTTAGVLALVGAGWLASSGRAEDPGQPATVTVTVERLVEGHPAWWWRRRSLANFRGRLQERANSEARGRTVARLRRTLAHDPSVSEALALARVVYGVDLGRRVSCESHGSPRAHNKSGASGLLQFLPSTWRTTPFAGQSIWSPYASALAGGWMVVNHRSGEWSCAL